MIIACLPEMKEELAFETLMCCQRLLMADERKWVKQERDVRDTVNDVQSGKNGRGKRLRQLEQS